MFKFWTLCVFEACLRRGLTYNVRFSYWAHWKARSGKKRVTFIVRHSVNIAIIIFYLLFVIRLVV